MAAEVSDVSNETSLLTSLNNLLPTTTLRVLVGSTFCVTLLFCILRSKALSRVTRHMDAVMVSVEWIYFSSAEVGLLDQDGLKTRHELVELQLAASELRERSLRASLSIWGTVQAFCSGLSFEVLRCTKEAKNLKTRIEIAREAELRMPIFDDP
ncbi:hypothetical protein B0H11DRAFT_1914269 [Mycena galericulata]|nr:hypothetical protein B0H11DRAFT_1914269 [Mycena galericulata]